MYSIGRNVRMDLYGNSHGKTVGCILEGIPSGIPISGDRMKEDMDKRRPSPKIGTKRTEDDDFHILYGIVNGITTGMPIHICIRNTDVKKDDYEHFLRTPRPGHADLPASLKGMDAGAFSGRLTAPIVAAGSIARQFLSSKGIEIYGFTRSIGNVTDDGDPSYDRKTYPTRSLTHDSNERMTSEIVSAAKKGDSVGGVAECHVLGLPIGFGGMWFDSIESCLSKGIFGIPGVKGIEFGEGFGLTRMHGSESNDPFIISDGVVRTRTNSMGGVLGGMSTGMPLVFRVAFKPTPSISREQETVDLKEMKGTRISVHGRHDPCIVPRAVSAVEAITALVISDIFVSDMIG